MTQSDPGTRHLVFSVIVPSRNRPAQLTQCLQALVALDYPHDAFEIIVVDDGASPETENIAARVVGTRAIAWKVVPSSGQGPAKARNLGATHARGRHLAFTDDDCQPDRGWLTRLGARLEAEPDAIAGGLTINALPSIAYSTASQLLIDYLYEYYRVDKTGARFFATNNLAIGAGAFRAFGGFDATFPLAAGEDREFCERWQRQGRRFVYVEDAIVHHAHRLGFRSFLRQHFNYGRGADFLHQSRARRETGRGRPKIEPPMFYLNLIRFPWTRSPRARSVPIVVLMFLTQVAYVAGYGFQRTKRALAGSNWTARPAARD